MKTASASLNQTSVSKVIETSIRSGDKLIKTKVRTTVENAVIEFADILEATTIETEDGFNYAPWEDSDGLEHTVIADDSDGNAAGYFNGSRHSRYSGHRRVVVEKDAFGNFAYHRANGASKQVAFQLARAEEKRTAEYIAQCYANGWNCFTVVCNFKGDSESVGGCYASEPTTCEDDAYLRETMRDIASQMASVLESQGYDVTGKPDRKAEYVQSRINEIRRKLNSQNAK
jgi:hypothetical protein